MLWVCECQYPVSEVGPLRYSTVTTVCERSERTQAFTCADTHTGKIREDTGLHLCRQPHRPDQRRHRPSAMKTATQTTTERTQAFTYADSHTGKIREDTGLHLCRQPHRQDQRRHRPSPKQKATQTSRTQARTTSTPVAQAGREWGSGSEDTERERGEIIQSICK